ncbi:MAG: hypothetical protein GY803_01015 [Chloroflexi bacterium]|nr:hypothetical protein [Chloroflexota bacterium]
MNQHPIYLSDAIYQLLAKRASLESRPLEQVAERLLAQELSLAVKLDNGQEVGSMSENVDEALAAVHRLTTLFADVEINKLEQALNDPILELANADLDIALL